MLMTAAGKSVADEQVIGELKLVPAVEVVDVTDSLGFRS